MLFISQNLIQVWRIKSVLRIYIFPTKFIKLCPESLKEHTDKISLKSDETQTFYWSFKYMSNYHLKHFNLFFFLFFFQLWFDVIYFQKELKNMFVSPKLNKKPYLSDHNIQTSVLSEKICSYFSTAYTYICTILLGNENMTFDINHTHKKQEYAHESHGSTTNSQLCSM